jgi:hypothetical protein
LEPVGRIGLGRAATPSARTFRPRTFRRRRAIHGVPLQRKIVNAMVTIHEAGGSFHGELFKLVLPWPVSAVSAVFGLCRALHAHHAGDGAGRTKAMVGVGTDALGAIPGAQLAVRGTGLAFHAVKRVKRHLATLGAETNASS